MCRGLGHRDTDRPRIDPWLTSTFRSPIALDINASAEAAPERVNCLHYPDRHIGRCAGQFGIIGCDARLPHTGGRRRERPTVIRHNAYGGA